MKMKIVILVIVVNIVEQFNLIMIALHLHHNQKKFVEMKNVLIDIFYFYEIIERTTSIKSIPKISTIFKLKKNYFLFHNGLEMAEMCTMKNHLVKEFQ
jgi:hypothetical protein